MLVETTYNIHQPRDRVWVVTNTNMVAEGDLCQVEIDLYSDSDDTTVTRIEYLVLLDGEKGTTIVPTTHIFDNVNDAVAKLGEIISGILSPTPTPTPTVTPTPSA